MKRLFFMVVLLVSTPAFTGHPWGGVDICAARRDTVPPGIDPALLPEPASEGAALLQRYCTPIWSATPCGRCRRLLRRCP